MARPSRRSLPALALALLAAAPVGLLAEREALAAEPRRYALSLFHFNIQYVAGGLVGFVPLFSPDSAVVRGWELDAEGVEDRIVTESFEPVLDLYLAHPTWGTDIELQAYFLEVLEARHHVVLEKLRRLAASGQIDVVSFHYSDQLFLAFPREDWERSQALARSIFDRLGIPLSTTVFAQEGQAGVGMARAMVEKGYRTLVWPKNLLIYQHGEFAAAPHYRLGEARMVAGGKSVDYDGPDGAVRVEWTFLNDGELLATGDWDPYFTPFFTYKPDAVAEYETEVAALEASGFSIATVRRYVEEIEALGVPPADPPPLLDGTWQPKDTDGIRRWLGGMGLWTGAERDNDVRTLQAMAHRELVAAETIAREAGLDRSPLDGAWRLLFLAQVSDSSGINPFRGEIEYGIAHATEAARIAREAIEEGKRRLGMTRVEIDVADETVEAGGASPADPGAEIEPRLSVRVDSGGRASSERWFEMAPGRFRVEIAFSPASGPQAKKIAAAFPGDLDEIVYCPGLAEDEPARVPKDAFAFDHYQLPLANGLIGLADRHFVVKDTARVHVAATIEPAGGDVTFADSTVPEGESITWVFHVVEGTLEEAVDYANGLNVSPRLVR